MFVLTKALVEHCVNKGVVTAELAGDIDKNKNAIEDAMMKGIDEGKLKASELKALADESNKKSGVEIIKETLDAAISPLNESIANLVKALTPPQSGEGNGNQNPTDIGQKSLAGSGVGAKAYGTAAGNLGNGHDGKSTDEHSVRLKGVEERFGQNKSFIPHQTKAAGIPGESGNNARTFEGFSELDKAVAGATLKYLMNRAGHAGQCTVPQWAKMTDLDNHLMEYAAHKMPWAGPVGMRGDDDESADYGFAKHQTLNDIQIKAVLDDATSGGLEAVPIVFDDLAVITPLLTSELLPLVDMRTTTRRRVEGFRLANPEMYWTAEGATPTEFDTAGFIGEFNTNIHPCVGWMELGLDFQADSPVAIADLIISRYAEKGRQKLEDAIAVGTGTGQPLGLTNTPGATTVASTNDTDGPPTVTDYEALYFAIKKEFASEAGQRLVYVANQTSYQRARSIPVGTSDQRRVFGTDNQSNYRLLDRAYKINHSVPNTKIFAACLNRYVMYRRLGFDLRRETGGKSLATRNMELLVMRMRYGGQLNHGGALAAMTDAQS